MDGQAARESSPFLIELRDIRNTLRRTLQSAQVLEGKLTGPRPPNAENINKIASESMRSLMREISVLGAQLEKTMEMQHAIIGGDDEKCPTPPQAVGY